MGILVRVKYYKSVAEIPHRVDEAMMTKAKSRARIIVANIMMATTVVCACITIYFARSNSKNFSLIEENQRRHLMYKKGETGSGSRWGLSRTVRRTKKKS